MIVVRTVAGAQYDVWEDPIRGVAGDTSTAGGCASTLEAREQRSVQPGDDLKARTLNINIKARDYAYQSLTLGSRGMAVTRS
jgi:hypothetical protein